MLWGCTGLMQRDRFVKRMAKACCPLRILVGKSGSYVEKTTPMQLTQMTVEQTASLLLMRKDN
jgi:hypothetical protein